MKDSIRFLGNTRNGCNWMYTVHKSRWWRNTIKKVYWRNTTNKSPWVEKYSGQIRVGEEIHQVNQGCWKNEDANTKRQSK